MLRILKNSRKELYKKYICSEGKEADKALAEVVEKYKSFSEKEKADFRMVVGKNMLKTANRNSGMHKVLKLAKEIGKATEWKGDETDPDIVQSIKSILEKNEDPCLTIAALDALYHSNYGEAEFWEKMLHKSAPVALFVVERISDVEGAEEVFRRNIDALIALSDQSKKCREMTLKYLNEANDEVKKKLLEKLISEGVHKDLLPAIPALFENRQTRYALLGWLTRGEIKINVDRTELPASDILPELTRKIEEVGQELVKKAVSMLPGLPPQERLPVHHFLATRGVRVKDEELEEKIEEMIGSRLESACPEALIEAYDASMRLLIFNPERGRKMMEEVFREAADVLEDDAADEKQKEVAAAVSFLYISNFQKKGEEFLRVREKALGILKRNGRVAPII